MKKQLILGTALALLALPAYAGPAQDAAYDKNANPVGDTNGHCVRTKWMDAADPCAIAVAKPPVAVYVPPPAPAPVPVMPVVTLEQRTIYFDFDSADLSSTATGKLDQLAGIINNSTAIADVSVHGFTDQFGSHSYNEVLANKRAAAVKTYLDQHSRLTTNVGDVRGLGKSTPAEGCAAIKKRDAKISCMAQERRVEVEFKAQAPTTQPAPAQ